MHTPAAYVNPQKGLMYGKKKSGKGRRHHRGLQTQQKKPYSGEAARKKRSKRRRESWAGKNVDRYKKTKSSSRPKGSREKRKGKQPSFAAKPAKDRVTRTHSPPPSSKKKKRTPRQPKREILKRPNYTSVETTSYS